jgi:hypothetical protein
LNLSALQRQFLRRFLGEPPDRRVWLDQRRHVLGPFESLDKPPAGAAGVMVYSLEPANGLTFKGAKQSPAIINLAALRGLAECWAVPLVRLNEAGRAATSEPAALAGSLEKRSFDLPHELNKRLIAEAAARGQPVAAYLCEMLAWHLEGGDHG